MILGIDLPHDLVSAKPKPVIDKHGVRILARENCERRAVTIANLQLRFGREVEQVFFVAVFDAANERVFIFALRQLATANQIPSDAARFVGGQLILQNGNRGLPISRLGDIPDQGT